ncbi:unnamed protein product [Rodentolepis nana]|uniref:Uncharacterized protein n=1 Tax=Rodentolepis nana TaxID=102285 RepID=A0A0R3TDE8_RODNA|nr:unnamed protein product [Rodentolepis nana]
MVERDKQFRAWLRKRRENPSTSGPQPFVKFGPSVVNANAYRDPSRKYCFGVDPPELKIPFEKEADLES